MPQEVQEYQNTIQGNKVESIAAIDPEKQIENVKSDKYEEFYQKHFLEVDKMAYVHKIAQATNKTETQIINSAIANESGFLTAFEKWRADQKKPEKKGRNKAEAIAVVPLAPHSEEVPQSMDEITQT